MQIHPDHLRAIEKWIPQKDRQTFLDQAIEEALKKIKPKKKAQNQSAQNPPSQNPPSQNPPSQNPPSQNPPSQNEFKIFTDGGSRGNPGRSGGGFVVYQRGDLVLSGSEYFGVKTNNQAEYLALRLALREVYSAFGDVSVQCFLDSKLAVEQVKGNYKVKSPNVKPLYEEVMRIADQFKSFSIHHVPREQNGAADALANEAMDRG